MRRRGTVVPLKRRGPLVERISFGIVRVYYEDIEEICTILAKVTSSVRIQADEFVATEPRDLLDMPSEVINRLQIVATEPSVTITLSANLAAAEATDADMGTLGALRRIEELMRGRRRRLKRFVWSSSSGGSLITLVALISAVLSLAIGLVAPPEDSSRGGSESNLGWVWLIGLVAVLVVASILAAIMGAQRQAIVIPRPQKEAPPFWERNIHFQGDRCQTVPFPFGTLKGDPCQGAEALSRDHAITFLGERTPL
jgi:hypothetical protein